MKRIAIFTLGVFAMFGVAIAQTPDIDTPLQALAAQEAVLPAAVAEVAVQHTAAAAQVVAQLTEAKIRA